MASLDLSLLEGELVVARLDRGSVVPNLPVPAPGSAGIVSVTTSANETSVVCEARSAPDGARISPGWRALVVAGPLDHALTGVLASIALPLAEARIPIFAVSTFDTDYVLVPSAAADEALQVLKAAGHRVAP